MGLKILIVSVEVAPHAKVGGLADVAASLPKALRAQGHDARLVMPGYGMVVDAPDFDAKVIATPKVTVNPHFTATARILEGDNQGVPTYAIQGPGMFGDVQRSEDLYNFGREAYLFFAQSVMEMCEQLGWIPDVIHCNDWHTGLLPAMIREKGGPKWESSGTVFTIHNLAYQGGFGRDTVAAAGLPESAFIPERLEFFGGVNFLKSACMYADQVNTVSPTYAKEILTEEYGCGLWGVMQILERGGRLRGILNGIDTEEFNPATDPTLDAHYSATDLSGKATCKAALQEQLGLPVDPSIPMFGIVSRLSNQKGFDLIVRAAYGLLDQPIQFVVLGVGDPWAASELKKLQAEWPDRVAFVNSFAAELANRIYAGCDFFLMPSAFEPCGLGQLIALRHGTVPVVRQTGGLADTIFEGRNGFVFENKCPRELLETVKRAISAYQSPGWHDFVSGTMREQHDWAGRAEEYVRMYQDALAMRQKPVAV